jgi:hypothetical protein
MCASESKNLDSIRLPKFVCRGSVPSTPVKHFGIQISSRRAVTSSQRVGFRPSDFGFGFLPAPLPGIISAVKPTAKAKPSPSPTRQIAGFIAKFDPALARLIRQCRAEVRKLLPTAVELVYDNYNFLVFGFATTERASDALISIAAASNGVGLCFIHGASLPDPQRILLGSGKQTRFIRLPTIAPLRSPAVSALLQAAVARAARPLPAKSDGYTVIKSISAKQRPRRRG